MGGELIEEACRVCAIRRTVTNGFMKEQKHKTILVTGATGHQGSAVLRNLHGRGFPVRAFTRDPDKPAARRLVGPGTEIVRGDLSDKESVVRALEGVWGAFSVQDSRQGYDCEVEQGVSFAEAANRSEIKHFVYSSVASADQKTGIPHFDSKFRIEEHIRITGLRYSIFRPVFFMENLLGFRSVIEQGSLVMPLDPETRLQMIAVGDIGAFVVMAFEHPGRFDKRVMELAGDELSMTKIAEALGRVAGRQVTYSRIEWDEFEKQMGRDMTTMFRWFQTVGYHVDIDAVRRERPELMNFTQWLNMNWGRAL